MEYIPMLLVLGAVIVLVYFARKRYKRLILYENQTQLELFE